MELIGKDVMIIPLPGVLLSNLAQNSSIASCGAWCFGFFAAGAGITTIGTSGPLARSRESVEPAMLPSRSAFKAALLARGLPGLQSLTGRGMTLYIVGSNPKCSCNRG